MYRRDQVYDATLEYFKGDKLATNVWLDKYCLKNNNIYYELTPRDMHKRLAKEFSRIENNYINPLSEQEIFDLLDQFKYIVPGGSPMEGIGNNIKVQSLSNCYVIGNEEDSYGSILKIDEEQVHIMRRRGGVGSDLSHLRPRGAKTTCAADTSTGIVPFAERYSNSTRETAQEGRRGARMISLDITHPDAEEFIDAKLEQGKITGANISVRITDEFMEAVNNDSDFYQRFPIDSKMTELTGTISYDDPDINEYNKLYKSVGIKSGYYKRIKAKRLWNKIIHNAWKSAEPGILFIDHIRRESPSDCYGNPWKSVSSNPCFTRDTIVAVADVRNGVTIKELAEQGESFLVYSAQKKKNRKNGWKTEIKKAIAFKTGNKKIIRLELSDGSFIRCTENHKLALPNGDYIEAKESEGLRLEKFYTFSNKNDEKSYRHINSKTNGYSKQYRLLWEYYYGEYDGKLFNIDHKDDNSKNDKIDNLQLLSLEDHKAKTKRFGKDNPIHKVVGTEYQNLLQKRKNIQANGRKYNWSNERIEQLLYEFDIKFGDKLKGLKNKDKNIDLSEDVYVKEIINLGVEDVYDLNVEDNHNFYIITKTDDEKYLNCSGILVHNCGEIPMNPYSSCILTAINLYSYVKNPFTDASEFDWDLFKLHVNKAQRLIDDIVDLEIEKIDQILNKINSDPESEDTKLREINLWNKIKQRIQEGRRTGLGVTAEGDMLAALNLRYGTEEATNFSENLHKIMAEESYISSIELAKERGCFPIWDLQKEKFNPFIARVLKSANDKYPHGGGNSGDYGIICDYYDLGRRNIANLTIAPTGSVSILTQTTSGIEPVFKIFYTRRRKTNDPTKCAFKDDSGDMWEEYKVFHHKFIEWYRIWNWKDEEIEHKGTYKDAEFQLKRKTEEELKEIIKQSPYHKATSLDVDYIGKVEMQGRVQKWIDHSISVTVNMPEDVTEEIVSQVYMKAYESGCKGITVYRENSRSGVLIGDSKEDKNKNDRIIYNDSPKRPELLICDIYNISRGGKAHTIIVGLLNNKPYEIFALEKLSNKEFNDNIQQGEICKVKSKVYKLSGFYEGKKYVIDNIVESMSDEERKNTRKYSMMLRHGIHPKHIIHQINEYSLITSFDKVISKVLSMYLNGEKIKGQDICPQCNGKNIKVESGCLTCPDCGWSKCG